MHAIETTGIIDCQGRLQVRHALPAPEGEVKIIVLFEDKPKLEPPSERRSFHDAIGGMYRRNPNAPRLSTAEWMKILREGDED